MKKEAKQEVPDEVQGQVAERPDDADAGQAVGAVASAPGAQPLATGWPRDEFTGQGGRYVRDPKTGLRRPA